MIGGALFFRALGILVVPHVARAPVDITFDFDTLLSSGITLRQFADVTTAMNSRARFQFIPRTNRGGGNHASDGS